MMSPFVFNWERSLPFSESIIAGYCLLFNPQSVQLTEARDVPNGEPVGLEVMVGGMTE